MATFTERFKEQLNRLKYLTIELEKAKAQGRRNSANSYRIQINNVRRDIAHDIILLKQRAFSSILEVTYIIKSKEYLARFTNISSEEATLILQAQFGQNVKILEIKEISTFLNKPKL